MNICFKEWLIREMSHKSFSIEVEAPIGHGSAPIDAIDFRFEDYPKNTQDDKNLIIQLYAEPPFFGKFPGSHRFVTFNGDKLEIRLKPPMIGSPLSGGYVELPQSFQNDSQHGWWDYAAGYLENTLVKKPLRMRDTDYI